MRNDNSGDLRVSCEAGKITTERKTFKNGKQKVSTAILLHNRLFMV